MCDRLSAYSKFTLENLELNQQIHIYIESVSLGQHFNYINMDTPIYPIKKSKMILLQEKCMELQA